MVMVTVVEPMQLEPDPNAPLQVCTPLDKLVIDPHPNDKIAQTFPISESNWSNGKRGNIIADVVIIETVDDPWADFITDAIINGINIPK